MQRPRYIIAGGSGLIGQALCQALRESADLIILTRSPGQYSGPGRAVRWHADQLDGWAGELEGALAVVNVAGRNLNTRWTPQARREIIASRALTTKVIGRVVARCQSPPRVWINASAVGIYGDRGDETLTEDATPAPLGSDFLADVCRQWEAALHEAPAADVRKVILRFGVVLSTEGGALPTLARLTKLFAGGRLGSGRQWVPWLHIRDAVRAITWAVETQTAAGVFNATAPEPVKNANLMAELRRVLGRPPAPPAPAFAARLAGKVLGLPVEPALVSVRAVPVRLLEQQFTFSFAQIGSALDDLLGHKCQ